MTLAAAFVVQTFPAMIADTMLSTDASGVRPHRGLQLNETGLADLRRIGMTSLFPRRKAAILHPRFAVAYAGSSASGAAMIRRLRNYCADGLPSRQEMFDYLRLHEQYRSPDTAVQLIGWIGEGGPFTAFRWDSTQPHEVAASLEAYIGSGAAAFEKVARHHLTTELKNAIRPDAFMARLLTECIRSEINQGVFSRAATGIWFEAVVFEPISQSFIYISPFAFRWIAFDGSGNQRLVWRMDYEAHHNYSAVSQNIVDGRMRVDVFSDADFHLSGQSELDVFIRFPMNLEEAYNGWIFEFPMTDGSTHQISLASHGLYELIQDEGEGRFKVNVSELLRRYGPR